MQARFSFVAGRFLTAVGLILAAGLLIPGDRAGAEDKPVLPGGTWTHDVRVVRVDTPTPGGIEAASPFPERKGATIALPWAEVLARLKKRGAATVLTDQRVTSLVGSKCHFKEETTASILVTNSADDNNTQRRATIVKTGVQFEQTIRGNDTSYDLEVRGTITPPEDGKPPLQYLVSWNGTHKAHEGPTLVLTHRRQLARPGAETDLGVEHYAFITTTFIQER